MILSNTDQVPQIDGLILIDCWEPEKIDEKKYLNLFYANLVTQLKKFEFKCVVNASLHCKIDGNDFSQLNVLNKYCWDFNNNDPRYILTDQEQKAIFNILKQNNLSRQVSTIINFCLLNNNVSAYITDIENFKYHNKKHLNNTCKNWLVVGQTWPMCTHNNEISLTTLKNIPDMNFYTLDQGFCKINGDLVYEEDYRKDTLNYEKISNFGYRLLPVVPILQ
jgi:hypothetical protein